jgi:hypothetical protein
VEISGLHIYTTKLHQLTPTYRVYRNTHLEYQLVNSKARLNMRSTLLLAALAPALIAAAPGVAPRITSLRISGSGCPNDSGSVKSSTGVLGDSASFTFSQLSSDNTNNCEIHVQSSGGSAGWQVGVQAVTYSGDLTLKPGTQLDTYTQIFWSDKAAETVSQISE